MRVAWIMSAFNNEPSVAHAVRSIQSQTFDDWRLAVVDDGSTDRTYEILADLAATEPRMQVIRQPRNLGLAASLNLAWRQAPAEVYARVDADDACDPQRLRIQLDFLQQHPEVAVLGSAARLVDAADREIGCLRRPEMHEDLLARIMRENPFIHPTVVMRRSFLEMTGGYDKRLRRAQDYDLWLRGAKCFRFHNLPLPLVRYQVRVIPSWSSIYWGTRMLARAVWRERRWSTDYWYALRYLTSATLMQLRLRKSCGAPPKQPI